MKTNAIVRICIYSLLILILLGVLGAALLGWDFFVGGDFSHEVVSQLTDEPSPTCVGPVEITVPDEEEVLYIGIAMADKTGHNTPHEEAANMWYLSAGDLAKVVEEKTIAGVKWGRISEPYTGWIRIDTDFERMDDPKQTEYVQEATESVTLSQGESAAKVLSQLNIRSTPSLQGTVLGTLYPGDQVVIDEEQSVQGVVWGHISDPTPGWVSMDFIELSQDPVNTTAATEARTATVPEKMNIRAVPSLQGTVLGQLDAGEEIEIDQVQTINGTPWGHIQIPVPGWIDMNYVELDSLEAVTEPTVQEPEAPQETAAAEPQPPVTGGTDFPANKVKKINIDWASGDVIIREGNTRSVNVSESAPGGAKPMVCQLKDGKLNIQFSQSSFKLGIGTMTSKDLTVTVPTDFDLRELEIDMAAGNVDLQQLTIDEVELDCADVECNLDNCDVRTLDVDTASGDINFSGTLEELDMDSASAAFVGVFTGAPRRIDMDGMSGRLDITLPEGCGFNAKIDGLSNRFHSDHPVQTVNGAYVYGDEACKIKVDGMSGEVTIRKAA